MNDISTRNIGKKECCVQKFTTVLIWCAKLARKGENTHLMRRLT